MSLFWSLLFTFYDHTTDLQILQGLKFSPGEVKNKTSVSKYQCQISYLDRYVWLTLLNFKTTNVNQSNSILYTKLQSESLKQVNYDQQRNTINCSFIQTNANI